MDAIVNFLNNRYLIAIVIGLALVGMLSRFARR